MRAAVALLALTFASPTSAHWQYTKWGMSPSEVQKAAKQPMLMEDFPDLSTAQSRIRAGTNYSAGGMAFTALFGFDDQNRLNRVKLSLPNTNQCVDLNQSLRSVYGEPLPGEPGSIYYLARWRDEEEGNMITLLAIGRLVSPDTCTVDYQPIRSRQETGL